MAGKSIANRWFINSFSVVAVFLLIVNLVVYLSLRNYYYGSVRQYLGTQANIIYGVLSYMDNYAPEIRRTIEEFDKKDHAELMAITKNGRIDITSGGFSPPGNINYEMPDYERAKQSEDGRAYYEGYLPNSEKYMALSILIPGDTYDAIRVVSSLDRIDTQIYATTLIVGALSAAVMLLVLFLGMYFIRSIVSPLRRVGDSAKRLAAGDFSDRVLLTGKAGKTDDEISELCRIFNSMADDLENSEKIKNDFISSVSHELRTPLTAIRGWSETLLEMGVAQPPDSRVEALDYEKGMKVITSETTRLSELVEDLLDFSKLQAGRLKLQETSMDVLAELRDAVSIYTEKAKKEGISMSCITPDSRALIYGDRHRIRQVFINIIDNAVKYCGENGKVKAEAFRGDNKVLITISDNGCGISERDLPKVKARFFKADNAVRGSGIGLAVADEIIAMHKGELVIESEQGAGTRVRIIFPVLPDKERL